MERSVGTAAVLVAAVFSLACDKQSDGDRSPPEKTSLGAALDEASGQPGDRAFDEALTKKACDLLTPERVGQTFDIPPAELQPVSMMGCSYRWQNKQAAEKIQLEVRFASLEVHQDEAVAKQWFANATKGMTREQTKQAMAAITQRAKQREEVDSEAKKKAVDQVGGALAEFAGSDGIRFESVDDVGDEARLNLSDGGLWVRTGNLTFTVSAYHGPPAPKPNFQNVQPQEIAKAALAANGKWRKETLPKRKQDAVKLAAVILKSLP